MIRTRVGYTGGSSENPTYKNIGDHAETVQIDFDPAQISYQELLDVFWDSHSPYAQSFSTQYASYVFYANDAQKETAEQVKARREADIGRTLYTPIVPLDTFYLAEDYHQKYNLQLNKTLLNELLSNYAKFSDFVNSTAAARVNGYLAGYGSRSQLLEEIENLGLSAEAQEKLLKRVRK